MDRQYGNGNGFHGDDGSSDGHGHGLGLGVPGTRWATRSEYGESDAGSLFSSEDDVWGAEIGGVSGFCPWFFWWSGGPWVCWSADLPGCRSIGSLIWTFLVCWTGRLLV